MLKLACLSLLIGLTGCVEKGRVSGNELQDIYSLSRQIKPKVTTKQEVTNILGTPTSVKNLKNPKNHTSWVYEWDSESESHTPLQKTCKEAKNVSHKDVDIIKGRSTNLEIIFDENGRVKSFDFLETVGKFKHAFVGND